MAAASPAAGWRLFAGISLGNFRLQKKNYNLKVTQSGVLYIMYSLLEDVVASGAPARGDPEILIAILDGPIDRGHACFKGSAIATLDFATQSSRRSAATQHGTHVASIIFGQDQSELRGVAPGCRGLSIPIFRHSGNSVACSQLELAQALLIALENEAHIINISGGQLTSLEPEPLLADALKKCADSNVLVIAAAGNDGCDCLHVPAAIGTVLAVGAADRTGRPLPSSNWGEAYLRNGLLAPGEDIPGAAVGGGVTRRSGTSFAAPIVSGVAALLLTLQKQLDFDIDPAGVRAALLQSSVKCTAGEDKCRKFLYGNLNLFGAVNLVSKGRVKMDSVKEQEVNTDLLVASEQSSLTAVGDRVSASGCSCAGTDKPCSCGSGKASGSAVARPQLVFALGKFGYDFGTDARRDSIAQFMPQGSDPNSPAQMLSFLRENPDEAEQLIWTLSLDKNPIYALRPAGAYAYGGYEKIIEGFAQQLIPPLPTTQADQSRGGENGTLRKYPAVLFSVPGIMSGTVQLLSGQVVPVIIPNIKGITTWPISSGLIEQAIERITDELQRLGIGAPEANDLQAQLSALQSPQAPGLVDDFLNRITRKYRNLGIKGSERALNFSATIAYTVIQVLVQVLSLDVLIDNVRVSRSAVCRVGSECYDVDFTLFKQSDITAALHILRFTIDVSDTVPFMFGQPAGWTERPN